MKFMSEAEQPKLYLGEVPFPEPRRPSLVPTSSSDYIDLT